MSKYTRIQARVIDQTIQLANVPLIASGGWNEVRVDFVFCNKWTGLAKTAVFYRDPKEAYTVLLVDDSAVVPAEVLEKEGSFYFGVFGTGEDQVRTTQTLSISIVKGAVTFPGSEPGEPTPDIYAQLMAAYGKTETAVAVERARIDELVAMRDTAGATTEQFSHNLFYDGVDQGKAYNCLITTNGVYAIAEINFGKITLRSGDSLTADFPVKYAPFTGKGFKCDTATGIHLEFVQPDEGAQFTKLTLSNNYSQEEDDFEDYVEFYLEYPLSSVSINEVVDLRIDFEGETHPTAGEVVRGLHSDLNNMRGELDSAVQGWYFTVTITQNEDGTKEVTPDRENLWGVFSQLAGSNPGMYFYCYVKGLYDDIQKLPLVAIYRADGYAVFEASIEGLSNRITLFEFEDTVVYSVHGDAPYIEVFLNDVKDKASYTLDQILTFIRNGTEVFLNSSDSSGTRIPISSYTNDRAVFVEHSTDPHDGYTYYVIYDDGAVEITSFDPVEVPIMKEPLFDPGDPYINGERIDGIFGLDVAEDFTGEVLLDSLVLAHGVPFVITKLGDDGSWEAARVATVQENGGSAEGAVLYTKQKLTPEQQEQARANIGAADNAAITDQLNELVGDISTALDTIIAMQEELIGV